MKFVAIPAAAIVLATGVLAQDLTINTPVNPVVCQPLLIQWSGGTGPYFVSLHPGAAPNDPAIFDFGGQQTGTSLTWTVNQPAGTSLDLTIRDSNGATQQSAPFSVQSGSDTSCLNGGSSSSGSASSSPSASGSAPASSTSSSVTVTSTTSTSTAVSITSTTSVASTTSHSSSSSSSSTKPAPSSTSSQVSNAAAPTGAVQYGAAGLVGAAIMAALV